MATTPSPSAQYKITVRMEYPHKPGWIARISAAIGEAGGVIHAIDLVEIRGAASIRDYSIECSSTEHADQIVRAAGRLEGLTIHSVSDDTFRMHQGGKLEIASRVALKTRADLSMAYTPGVARICKAIAEEPGRSFDLTIRGNCIAVVSDGSAVLGLGNIGPEAALPVMEGKAILFKQFAGVDAFPICVDTQDTEQIIDLCRGIAPTFGGINLEDISAPRCFEIEERLRRELEIPVFHDDQHGTAVVVLAGLINALKLTRKALGEIKVVVAGVGAAGVACTRIMKDHGVKNLVVCDSKGAIHSGRSFGSNRVKEWVARHTNPDGETGALTDVIKGADMFLGVSAPGILGRRDIESMNSGAIVFAMSNPDPEVPPEEIHDVVGIMATGRSDYPNQINNVLAFPGIFRGALNARARTINEEMKRAAAGAIAAAVAPGELSPEYIIPSVFNRDLANQVACAVERAAHESGVARPPESGRTSCGI